VLPSGVKKMIINIQALTKSEQLNFEGEHTLLLDEFSEQAPISECNVKVKGTVTRDGDVYTVTGNVYTVLTLQCDRCMKEVGYPLHSSLQCVFTADVTAMEEDVKPVLQFSIDLSDDIREAVVMEMPMKVLCKEDCLGLCTKCGSDLNSDACMCHQGEIDPRLEGLKDIFCQ
jgi:uncharacterized protein